MSEDMEPLEKIIIFREPIVHGGQTFTEITLVPPTIGQRRQAEGKMRGRVDPETTTQYAIQLVQSVAKVPQGVVEQMHGDQFEEAYAWVQGFFGRGLPIGAN